MHTASRLSCAHKASQLAARHGLNDNSAFITELTEALFAFEVSYTSRRKKETQRKPASADSSYSPGARKEASRAVASARKHVKWLRDYLGRDPPPAESIRKHAAALRECIERNTLTEILVGTKLGYERYREVLDVLARPKRLRLGHVQMIEQALSIIRPFSAGRDRSLALYRFINRLAAIYEEATGKRAGISRDSVEDQYCGPFWSLLRGAVKAVGLNIGDHTLRDHFRTARELMRGAKDSAEKPP